MPVAVQNAHIRILREEPISGGRPVGVLLDRDERRLRPERVDDPGGTDADAGPDLGEATPRPSGDEHSQQPPDLRDRRKLEAHRRSERLSAMDEVGNLG